MNYGKGLVSYETDRRKTQAESQILAYQLPSGEWTGAFAFGIVRYVDPDVRVVVSSGPVIPDIKLRGEGNFCRAFRA